MSEDLQMGVRVLTPQIVAERLGVETRTVQKWCAQGRLPAQKPGRDWLISEESLAKFEPPVQGRPSRKANVPNAPSNVP